MFDNMRKTKIAAAVATTLAIGTLAAVPAEAAGMQGPGFIAGTSAGYVQDVAWKKHYNGGHGNWHGNNNNNNWVAPLIGGMVIGGMLAAPYYGYGYSPTPRYYAPAPRYRYYTGYGNHDAYCHARFRSYSSYTGLYLGYDGRYHRC